MFKCFEIPDDEVRLSLVNCILQVPLSELDIEEINYLMNAIREAKNIGAGKAEEIISTIFMIFINLVKDQVNSASKSFRIKYGGSAIEYCLHILLKNQKRFLEEEDEAQEKLMLSVSCLFFLKEASKSPEMYHHMEDRDLSKYFYDNLLSEQIYSYANHINIPVELEYTTLGANFFNLRETLFGNKCLDAWNRVSFRVIQQIANVLQNLDPLTINDLKKGPVEKKTEAMQENLSRGLQNRIRSELDLWFIKRENEYEALLNYEPFYQRVEVQHKDFALNSGLYLLTTFLTRKNIQKDFTSTVNKSAARFQDDGTNNPLLREELFNKIEKQAYKFDKEFKDLVDLEGSDSDENDERKKRKHHILRPNNRSKKGEVKYVNMKNFLEGSANSSLIPKLVQLFLTIE